MRGRPRKGEGVDPDTVLEVAAEVFATRGYAGTTLEEVGRRMGVTRQAVLHHFQGKQQLFHAVLDRERQWAGRAALAPTDPTDPAAPFASLEQYLGGTAESRGRIRLQHVLQGEAIAGDPVAQEFVAGRTRFILEQIEARVRSVADDGRLAPGWTVTAATTALVGVINGLQALSLVDASTDVRTPFRQFVESIITEESEA